MTKGPTDRTIKRLFATYGNQCAFPNCAIPLVDPQTGVVLGEICHIKGHKPGTGPKDRSARYDARQSDEERHGFDNLIMLCRNHHKVVDDDPEAYTVERLQKMKREHEARHTGGPEPSDAVTEQLLTNLIQDIHKVVVGGEISVGPTDTESYAQQRANWEGPLLTTISERGYWEVIIHPAKFIRERLDKRRLQPLMWNTAVDNNSWFFPLIDHNHPHARGADWIGDEVERALSAPEAWRLYQSGQFVDRWGFWEDWEDSRAFPSRRLTTPGQLLEVETTVAIPTLAFLLAAHFVSSDEYKDVDAVYISIKAMGLSGRTLFRLGGSGLSRPHTNTTVESVYAETLAREDVLQNYRDHALKVAEDIFWLLRYEPDREQLRAMQRKALPDE